MRLRVGEGLLLGLRRRGLRLREAVGLRVRLREREGDLRRGRWTEGQATGGAQRVDQRVDQRVEIPRLAPDREKPALLPENWPSPADQRSLPRCPRGSLGEGRVAPLAAPPARGSKGRGGGDEQAVQGRAAGRGCRQHKASVHRERLRTRFIPLAFPAPPPHPPHTPTTTPTKPRGT